MFVFARERIPSAFIARAVCRTGVPVILCLALLAGCDEAFQNSSLRARQEAEKKYNEGDYRAAIGFYEAALDGTEKTAGIHYSMGLIYDDKINDLEGKIHAIHHFQRYLDFAPNGSHAKEARNFINEDRLKLLTTLSKGALLTQDDAARLKNDNLLLRKQLTELRAMPHYAPPKGGAPAEPGRQVPVPPGARTYVVGPGDTLASISRKFFKTSERWKDIQDMNYNALGGTVKLKPGMTLIIPD